MNRKNWKNPEKPSEFIVDFYEFSLVFSSRDPTEIDPVLRSRKFSKIEIPLSRNSVNSADFIQFSNFLEKKSTERLEEIV